MLIGILFLISEGDSDDSIALCPRSHDALQQANVVLFVTPF